MSWDKGTADGQNETLLKLAVKLNELTRLGIEAKLKDLKAHVKAESDRIDHPVMREFEKYVAGIKIG